MAEGGDWGERLAAHARALAVGWIGYWIVLTGLLHSPKLPRAPISISPRGLVIHGFTFALLGLGCAVVQRARRRPMTWGWVARWSAVFMAYGAASELLQPLSGRHCDVWDWVADTGGAVGALLVCKLAWSLRSAPRGEQTAV